MTKRFFITTAIDYTNGAPHLGHAYEKVLADVLARYHRLKGEEVYFLTGVDQHGQKVQQSAEKEGVSPQEFVDRITAQFRALWTKLGVEYSGWAATTDERHTRCVRAILQRLWDDKDPATGRSRWLYKDKRGGYYSVRQEQFLTDKERGPDGQFGPEWGQVEFREEENYYFRLEEHRQWLLDLIDERSREGCALIIPEFRVAELRNAVEKLAGRPLHFPPEVASGLGHRVPVRLRVRHVRLVRRAGELHQFRAGVRSGARRRPDANFAVGGPRCTSLAKTSSSRRTVFTGRSCCTRSGSRTTKSRSFLVHGWWNIAGEKMSKSLGNSVDPDVLADQYGAEALRYYLMKGHFHRQATRISARNG